MPEETAPTEGTEETNSQTEVSQENTFEAITSQDAFDKAIQARIARERAKFADYDELKTAKTELDKIRESQKTEAEKAQERLEAAEKRAHELELRSIRAEVAAEKGVPVGLLSGNKLEDIQASADALIEFRGQQASAPAGPVVPTEGVTRGSGASQLTQSDIETMSPEQINKARREGRLNRLLGIS